MDMEGMHVHLFKLLPLGIGRVTAEKVFVDMSCGSFVEHQGANYGCLDVLGYVKLVIVWSRFCRGLSLP